MNEVLLDIRTYPEWIKKTFENKDFISVEELYCAYEDAVSEIESLKEKIEDMERDMEDNYRPIPQSEQYGI
ncbi:MAG: hypothetical protein IKN65_00880 [Clostridia bacterium]|nr:hypothetical protein [Bacilli bacterium]MBR3672838.1 hypothetical protein [Clostridia bacterium]